MGVALPIEASHSHPVVFTRQESSAGHRRGTMQSMVAVVGAVEGDSIPITQSILPDVRARQSGHLSRQSGDYA